MLVVAVLEETLLHIQSLEELAVLVVAVLEDFNLILHQVDKLELQTEVVVEEHLAVQMEIQYILSLAVQEVLV
jgi:hypothetical protein